MSVSETSTRTPSTETDRIALAVADAGWFTTENLFREVPEDRASTLLLQCADYRVAWNKGWRPWAGSRALEKSGARQWRREVVLPSGWMKSYPKIGMRPIGRVVRRWRHREAGGDPLALVLTYPFYIHLARMVLPDRLVYLAVDDYRLYWPKSAELVTTLEHKTVREADLTACTSMVRAEELRKAVPEAADRIVHLPHGAPSSSIPDRPRDLPDDPPADLAHLPRPLIGYIGTLEDRVDWALMLRIARSNPAASIVLVGRIGRDDGSPWQEERSRCLALPNVHPIGWRPQSTIDSYNRSFDVGLIPYRVDHPFNQACCPTKIMDYMAAGRPVVSTDLPECRLYPHLFDVVAPGDFVEALESRIAQGPDDGRAAARLSFARENSCRRVAERILDAIA
ncbi:glycosyltransferase [Tundrisphaera lichenicola]|uniref:glycosyltransferase n=1 Tax=Tundrisphaera lichenicola TaxID=2029860 RepID=UPI003EB857D4